jgi:hypothetical protein
MKTTVFRLTTGFTKQNHKMLLELSERFGETRNQILMRGLQKLYNETKIKHNTTDANTKGLTNESIQPKP